MYNLEEPLFSPYHRVPSFIPQKPLYHQVLHLIFCLQAHTTDPTRSQYSTFWEIQNPGLDNPQFRRWRERGISDIRDVFDPGGDIYTFEHLRNAYDLPNRDFYMCLQVRHFVNLTNLDQYQTV